MVNQSIDYNAVDSNIILINNKFLDNTYGSVLPTSAPTDAPIIIDYLYVSSDGSDSRSNETSRETKLQSLAADGIDIHETTEQRPVIKQSIALRDDQHYRIDPTRFYGLFRSYVRQDWVTINVREGGEIEELSDGLKCFLIQYMLLELFYFK